MMLSRFSSSLGLMLTPIDSKATILKTIKMRLIINSFTIMAMIMNIIQIEVEIKISIGIKPKIEMMVINSLRSLDTSIRKY